MKKDTHRSSFECEYLVGDDSCRAVKESDMGALRAEACRNEIKDACCYLCSSRKSCDISCDLPKYQKDRIRPENSAPKRVMTRDTLMECGNCVYYLKRECPRAYSSDTELWRRQDPCGIFQSTQKE